MILSIDPYNLIMTECQCLSNFAKRSVEYFDFEHSTIQLIFFTFAFDFYSGTLVAKRLYLDLNMKLSIWVAGFTAKVQG